jgi:hypothetical protein
MTDVPEEFLAAARSAASAADMLTPGVFFTKTWLS